jgi:O-antigen ligase
VTGLDREVTQSAGNDFRETLNRFALDEIRERPVLGRGFKVDLEALYYLENNPSQVLGADDHFAGAKYAATSNWHNTWLGISADFGIPAAVIFAFLMIGYFRKSLRVLRQLDQKSFQWALVAGILTIVIGDLIRSWQFGHASLTYWNISWKVGVLFAVENWVRATNTKKIAAQREGGQEPPQQSEGMRFTRSRQGG